MIRGALCGVGALAGAYLVVRHASLSDALTEDGRAALGWKLLGAGLAGALATSFVLDL